jgi:hypothetical protein
MTRQTRLAGVAMVGALACAVWPVRASGQAGAGALATVRIPRAVVADGRPLAAGTYAVRLSSTPVTPVVGQSSDATRWVEFVAAGESRGRELATVLSGDAAAGVIEGRRPAPGQARVDLLKGGDYLRIWINHDGTHYLIHLGVAPGPSAR